MANYIIAVLLFGYLMGSIPFGWIIGKIYNLDIRKYGSGNIGATNAYRTLGLAAGLSVFILDMLKGSLAVLAAIIMSNDPLIVILTGLMAVVGHIFPVFLKFKGGRGSAVGLGVLLVIAPEIFAAVMILVVVIVALTRYVSLASIAGSIGVAAAMYFMHKPPAYFWATVIIAVLILIRHIPNIKRLINGTERKFGEKENGL
jgi:acyl phosphate:glycerol-3-phosphate acyltransferase